MDSIGSAAVSTNTGDNQYAITEFTEGGFILSTGQVQLLWILQQYNVQKYSTLCIIQDYESENDESNDEVIDDVNIARDEGGGHGESDDELNQAISEYKSGGIREDSTLSPPTNSSNRRDSNVYISPNLYMSSSSSEDSLSMFDKGHQGSYVLRKVSLIPHKLYISRMVACIFHCSGWSAKWSTQ